MHRFLNEEAMSTKLSCFLQLSPDRLPLTLKDWCMSMRWRFEVWNREPTDPGCWKCHPRMSMIFVHLWCCQSAFWPLIWFPKWIWPTERGLETLWACSWLAVVQDLEFCVYSKYGIWLKISFLWIRLLCVKPETQLICETSNKVVSWISELKSSPRTQSDQLGYGQPVPSCLLAL